MIPHGFREAIVSETTEQRVGIDRCEGAFQTLFALTLMELGKFDWRGKASHEWEVGRWPGLGLTLLAQPEWGPHRPQFAICPLPKDSNHLPFILLMALGGRIESPYQNTQNTSVTLLHLTIEQVQRDVVAYAHRVFDLALRLQHSHLEARYIRFNCLALPNLPCMSALMKMQYHFTAPMSRIHTGCGTPLLD
jgi:hypothetical protein